VRERKNTVKISEAV